MEGSGEALLKCYVSGTLEYVDLICIHHQALSCIIKVMVQRGYTDKEQACLSVFLVSWAMEYTDSVERPQAAAPSLWTCQFSAN